MRPIRVLLAISAAAAVAAACSQVSTPTSAGPAGASDVAVSAAAPDIASLSGAEILSRAKAAFKAAKSVHVIGDGTSGQGKSTFRVDMRYRVDGAAIGTVTNADQTIELRRIGPVIYVKGSKEFWTGTSGAAAGTRYGGKYVKAAVTDKWAAGLITLTDKGSFLDFILSTTTGVKKGSAKTINGIRAIPLTTKDDTSGGTMYVAATGRPLPVSVLPPPRSKDIGKVDFLDYDASVTVAVPPAAQTITVPVAAGN